VPSLTSPSRPQFAHSKTPKSLNLYEAIHNHTSALYKKNLGPFRLQRLLNKSSHISKLSYLCGSFFSRPGCRPADFAEKEEEEEEDDKDITMVSEETDSSSPLVPRHETIRYDPNKGKNAATRINSVPSLNTLQSATSPHQNNEAPSEELLLQKPTITVANNSIGVNGKPLPEGFGRLNRHTPEKLVQSLISQLQRPLAPRERLEASIYAVINPDTRLVRVGLTRHPDITRRLGELAEHCGWKPILFMERRVPYAGRLERLIHEELDSHRLVEFRCRRCGHRHQEWFDVSTAEVTEIVDRWIGWFTTNHPYDSDGGFNLNLIDSLYQAKKLKTLDAFHDRLSSGQLADSIASIQSEGSDTLESELDSTLVGSYHSATQDSTALEALKQFMINDEKIKLLISAASERSILSRKRLEGPLSSLLERLAYDFEDELKAVDERTQDPSPFLYRNAKRLSQSIIDTFFPVQAISTKMELLHDLGKQSKEGGRRQILTKYIAGSARGSISGEAEVASTGFEPDKGIGYLARNLVQPKESWQPADDDEDSTSRTSSLDAVENITRPPSLEEIRDILPGSNAYVKFLIRLREYITGSLFSWPQIQEQWERELREPASFDLQSAESEEVQFILHAIPSPGDWIKNALESFTDGPWDWWPWQPPTRKLSPEKVRVRWRCVCNPFLFPSLLDLLVIGMWSDCFRRYYSKSCFKVETVSGFEEDRTKRYQNSRNDCAHKLRAYKSSD
jgi:T5orf172 domain